MSKARRARIWVGDGGASLLVDLTPKEVMEKLRNTDGFALFLDLRDATEKFVNPRLVSIVEPITETKPRRTSPLGPFLR